MRKFKLKLTDVTDIVKLPTCDDIEQRICFAQQPANVVSASTHYRNTQ